MIQNSDMKHALPNAALDMIPEAKENAPEIVALVKHSGTVTGYQLSNGDIVSKQTGVEMAKAGGIKGVGIAHRNQTEYLKSLPDDTENNNLSHLPTLTN